MTHLVKESMVKNYSVADISSIVRSTSPSRFANDFRHGFIMQPVDFVPSDESSRYCAQFEKRYIPVPRDGLQIADSGLFACDNLEENLRAAYIQPSASTLYVGPEEGHFLMINGDKLDAKNWSIVMPNDQFSLNDSRVPLTYVTAAQVHRAYRR